MKSEAVPLLRLEGISKSFAGVSALQPLDLDIRPGEIHGLIGENGAGKSTLIKILSGIHHPNTGTLFWKGNPVQFESPRDALNQGIATIHQELEYFGRLTVAENLLVGERWPRKFWGGANRAEMSAEATRRLAKFELPLSPSTLFDHLTAAEKQEVAIAAALSRDAKLLILDEPTASLTEPEAQRLFGHLERLRKQGVAMIYVSHRMDEIANLTDRVTILRDGELIRTGTTASFAISDLIQEMVGRSLEQSYPRRVTDKTFGEPLLELNELSKPGFFEDVSLSVRAGEIIGLGGLVGAGRSELARAIFGLYGVDCGTMRLHGNRWTPKSARESLRNGLIYLPEERKTQGLVLGHSLRESVSIGFSDLLSNWGMISTRRESSRVTEVLESFDVRAASETQSIGTLSGGNQQKAMLGRWLARDPDVIILDEPTRGVDVGAKSQIHATIDRLAAEGKGVLLISSDLTELIGMSDRIFVMNRGRISAELSGDNCTEEAVILAASGLQPTTGNNSA